MTDDDQVNAKLVILVIVIGLSVFCIGMFVGHQINANYVLTECNEYYFEVCNEQILFNILPNFTMEDTKQPFNYTQTVNQPIVW